ncbi:MAG: hypothetical protein PHH59_16290 [Methylovulum sp.]|uniref:hypothetical protein n=1 Tax=Methylovulum sp. TaxID=1916980 RepID=UPI00263390FC|nr:hypothetical protein [Methylovulum sp.]MDD2725563.1 hypothetical protein [Methylovulum sp.]MDD5125367.1 hypothetical protein [Methylovulum sp.]
MNISTLGFPAYEQAKLAKLLPLGKNRAYHLQTLEDGNLPTVVLVFGEEHLAHPALTQATDGSGCAIAVVSAKPPSGGQLHIPYPHTRQLKEKHVIPAYPLGHKWIAGAVRPRIESRCHGWQ